MPWKKIDGNKIAQNEKKKYYRQWQSNSHAKFEKN